LDFVERYFFQQLIVLFSVKLSSILGSNVGHDKNANHATIWEEYTQLKKILGFDKNFKGFEEAWTVAGRKKTRIIDWTAILALMVFYRFYKVDLFQAGAHPISHWKRLNTAIQYYKDRPEVENIIRKHFEDFGENSKITFSHFISKSFNELREDVQVQVLDSVVKDKFKNIGNNQYVF
jgi:hypothetical protein